MNKHKLWVEKYRPKTIEDYIFYDEAIEKSVKKMIENKTIPHLLFSGPAGTGKSTLAFLLIDALGVGEFDVLTLNSSDENSVDVMRDKIKRFVQTHALGPFKIVHLEEFDYTSQNGQAILRRLMEEFSDSTRFIMTCNYVNKILPEIKSRSQHFVFRKSDFGFVMEYVYNILKKEGVKTDIDTLESYTAAGYPDIRKIINLVQQNSVDGVLQESKVESEGDYRFKLLELLGENQWDEARELVCREVTDEEWDDVFEFLYENLDKCSKFKDKAKWEQGIIDIADHLYRHSLVNRPAINVAALFIKLAQI